MADAGRVRQLETAANADFVVERRTGKLLRIVLSSLGEDYGRRGRAGNPQKDVYRAESADNPLNVWAFKRQCGPAGEHR